MATFMDYHRSRHNRRQAPQPSPVSTPQTTPAPSPVTTPSATPGPSALPGPNEPQFDDPSIRRLESHAMEQFEANRNPAAGSGSRLYEDYLRQYGQQLQQPAFSRSEQSVLTTWALDQIEREKQQQKQRYLEELSRRGLSPSDPVALDGLMKIDNHYAGLRTQTHAGFARDAITQTRQDRAQAADVYGALAGAERGRQATATEYARVPYALTQDAFSRNATIAGLGSPESYLSNQIGLAQGQSQFDQQRAAGNARMTQAMFEYLAYLYPELLGGF